MEKTISNRSRSEKGKRFERWAQIEGNRECVCASSNSVCIHFAVVTQWNPNSSRFRVTCVRNNVIRETNSRQLIFRIEISMNRGPTLPDTSVSRVGGPPQTICCANVEILPRSNGESFVQRKERHRRLINPWRTRSKSIICYFQLWEEGEGRIGWQVAFEILQPRLDGLHRTENCFSGIWISMRLEGEVKFVRSKNSKRKSLFSWKIFSSTSFFETFSARYSKKMDYFTNSSSIELKKKNKFRTTALNSAPIKINK